MTRKKRKKFSFLLFFPLLVILIIFFTISNFKLFEKRRELKKELSLYQREIEKLENQNQQLRAEISKSKDEDYWEKIAREQGYQRPGEKTVVFLVPEEEKEVKREKSFFEKIFEWIKNLK